MKRLARKPISLLIMVLLIGIVGCSQYGEEKGLEKATAAFQSDLKKVVLEIDEIQVFTLNEEEIDKPKSTLVHAYKKGHPIFDKLTEGFINASNKGEIVRSLPDKKIIFLKEGKKMYELQYCSIDGRIVDEHDKGGYYGVLFLPETIKKFIN